MAPSVENEKRRPSGSRSTAPDAVVRAPPLSRVVPAESRAACARGRRACLTNWPRLPASRAARADFGALGARLRIQLGELVDAHAQRRDREALEVVERSARDRSAGRRRSGRAPSRSARSPPRGPTRRRARPPPSRPRAAPASPTSAAASRCRSGRYTRRASRAQVDRLLHVSPAQHLRQQPHRVRDPGMGRGVAVEDRTRSARPPAASERCSTPTGASTKLSPAITWATSSRRSGSST